MLLLKSRRDRCRNRRLDEFTKRRSKADDIEESDTEEETFSSSSSTAADPQSTCAWNFVECGSEAVRVVRFSPNVEEVQIEWHREMPEDLKNAIWYNSIERRKIQDSIRRTLCLMNTDTDVPPEYADNFCPRGLEGRTRKVMKKRTINRNLVRDSVLSEQKHQKDHAIDDPEMLAQAAGMAAPWAQKEAITTAAHDERDAQDYLQGFDPTTLVTSSPEDSGNSDVSILSPSTSWSIWNW